MPVLKAVASSTKTPGVYLRVNLLAAASNPGLAALRTLIIAPQNTSGGNIVAGTEVRQVFGPDDVAVAVGYGNPGHLAAKRLFQKYPIASVDIVSPAESGGAAAGGTQTFSGTASENSTLRFRIHGRQIEVPWNSGETAATFVTRAVGYINQQGNDLFVTAAADTADIDYTAKSKGPWGNDVKINVSVVSGGGGITISNNPAALTSGTTEPNFTTALGSVSTAEYRRIIACVSNAEAISNSATSNPGRLATHIDTYESGLTAALQVGVVGCTAAIADVQTGAIAKNNEAMEYVYGQNFEDLPSELAGADVGDAIKFISIRPNYNRIGNPLDLYGPKDTVADKLTAAETETLLSNGVTPLDLERGTNRVLLVEPITTHSLSGSAPDYRAYHLSDTDGSYSVFSDLKVALAQQFANCSISPDLEPGDDELPAGVVERRDVQAFTYGRLRAWVREGVINGPALDASNDNGDLIVEIDSLDSSQVNIFIPYAILKPLAKISLYGSKVA